MGLSFGGGSSQSATNQTATQNKTFSPGQTSLQDQLGKSLSSVLTASDTGTLSPGVTAQKTQAADNINKTAGGLTDRVNSFLAARGFGKSGATGKATLQGELGRESQLAGNEANFAQVQQNVNGQNLLASLNYALTSLGQTGTQAGTASGSGFNWGASASGAGSSAGGPVLFGA